MARSYLLRPQLDGNKVAPIMGKMQGSELVASLKQRLYNLSERGIHRLYDRNPSISSRRPRLRRHRR